MFKKISRILAFFAVLQMVFGSLVTFAAEGDDVDTGTPKIEVINGPVFDVDAGTTNEVTVEIRNVSSSGAKNIIVVPKITDVTNNPLSLTLSAGHRNFSSLAANTTKKLTFNVDVDKAAAAKTYSVDVKFNYLNQSGAAFETTSTIYFKVRNTIGENAISIEKITVNPDDIEIGDSGDLSIVLKNKGSLNLYNLEVALTELSATGVSVNGESIKKIGTLQGGLIHSETFKIATTSATTVGNYPVTITVKGNDENGTEHTATQIFYISVGGSSSGKKGDLEIRNMVEPNGNYGVNQDFDVSFDVFNKGDGEVKDVKISANEVGAGGNVVPKSSSVISVRELAANDATSAKFTFAATSAATSKNYTIEFTVEYTQNGQAVSFKQYAGVDINNPDAEEDAKISKPKIIISQYVSDPVIVQAGSEFDLSMTLLNTHAEKSVKNIKVYLTLAEETSTDSTSKGNIFTPVNSSNTFYFDSMPPKGTIEKQLRLYVVPEAQPKTYTLTVNFDYEDSKGNEYQGKELLGINVTQSAKVETSEISVPTSMEKNMSTSIFFDIYNTGKVDISNLKVELKGDIETTNKVTFVGNSAKGEVGYYEGSFSVVNVGENKVQIVVSYDTPSGERIEDVREYTIEGTEPMPTEPVNPDDMMVDSGNTLGGLGSLSKPVIAGIIGAIVLVLIAIIIIVKKVKARKEARFIEENEEDDDENDDDMKK